MPRATFLLASLMCFSLIALNFAQEDTSQNPSNETQNQAESNKARSQQEGQQQKANQKNQQQVVEVGLDQGQTIAIPAGGELLELTVAVPETVRAGQRYRYHARVRNVSEKTALANVRLVQIDGSRIDIEDAQIQGQKQQQSQNAQQQQAEAKKQQASESQQSADGANTSWSLGKLNPGESQSLAVTAIASETGKIDHCFAVRYEEVLCTQLDVVQPTVTITKAGPEQATVCEIFEYRYELKNTGTGVAKNFIVRDPLPEGLKTKSGKSEIEFRVPELKEGQTESYVAQVHSMKAGQYQSRAVVEQESGETRQSKQVATNVIAPELEVKIEGPRAIKAGEGGNFDVTVTNTSDVPARNVVLTIDPDDNAQVSNAGKGDAREGGKSYRYDLGDMKPQESKLASISLDSEAGGNVTLAATAQSLCARDQGETMAVAEAEANLEARVMRITSLLISLVDTDDVIPKGEEVTYRLRVRNQGSFPDKNVKVNLKLPNGLKFKEGDGPSELDANGQRISLGTVDQIDAGETLEWHITTTAQSPGEKVVEGTLDSDGLSNTVETQEVSTIYDASKQQKASDSSTSSKEASQGQSSKQEASSTSRASQQNENKADE